MTDPTFDAIAARLAAELRRLPCRSREKCEHCAALAEYDQYVARRAIVQTPAVAAEQVRKALRAAADHPGERHDG